MKFAPSFRLAALLLLPLAAWAGDGSATTAPSVRKLGTLECDMVECTPVVFAGRIKLVEYVRANYHHRQPDAPGETYFRVVDLESGQASPPFAAGCHLCCAIVEGDALYVFGVDHWGGETIRSFHSTDMIHWSGGVALHLPGWGIYNTSACKADDRYVMALEIDRPPQEAGVPFTSRFAESKDLIHWSLTPADCAFAKDRYTACPTLRYLDDGRFYLVYLEQEPGPRYQPYVARSKDLIHWQAARNAPILSPSVEDRAVALAAKLTEEEKRRIATAVDVNNSDVDFCQFHGELLITYSWGNQLGVEHLALATYPGSLAQFLRAPFETKP